MPKKCPKIWFFKSTWPKSLPKRDATFWTFEAFLGFESKMAPEWAPDLQNHQKLAKKHRISIICSSISALNIWFGYYFLQAFLQFLAANLSGLRRSTYSGCSSKLSLQTVRGCGDGTPQASSIMVLAPLGAPLAPQSVFWYEKCIQKTPKVTPRCLNWSQKWCQSAESASKIVKI